MNTIISACDLALALAFVCLSASLWSLCVLRLLDDLKHEWKKKKERLYVLIVGVFLLGIWVGLLGLLLRVWRWIL